MVTSCSAYGCTKRHQTGSKLGFFLFPKDPQLRERWIKAVKRKSWTPSASARICGEHFQTGKPSIEINHPDYVPNVFNFKLPERNAALYEKRQKSLAARRSVKQAIDVKSNLCKQQSVGKKRTSQLHQDNKNVLLYELNHDVILKVGDKKLHAHKDVLQAQSPVFKSLLSHDIMKENSVIIEVYDCDPLAMEQFLLYMYSGKVERLDQTNMLSLHYIADKYDMEHLKEECCDFIKKSLSVTNICEVIQFALNHRDSVLLDSATEFFGNNVLDILHSMEWQFFLKDNPAATNELLIKYFEKSKK